MLRQCRKIGGRLPRISSLFLWKAILPVCAAGISVVQTTLIDTYIGIISVKYVFLYLAFISL